MRRNASTTFLIRWAGKFWVPVGGGGGTPKARRVKRAGGGGAYAPAFCGSVSLSPQSGVLVDMYRGAHARHHARGNAPALISSLKSPLLSSYVPGRRAIGRHSTCIRGMFVGQRFRTRLAEHGSACGSTPPTQTAYSAISHGGAASRKQPPVIVPACRTGYNNVRCAPAVLTPFRSAGGSDICARSGIQRRGVSEPPWRRKRRLAAVSAAGSASSTSSCHLLTPYTLPRSTCAYDATPNAARAAWAWQARISTAVTDVRQAPVAAYSVQAALRCETKAAHRIALLARRGIVNIYALPAGDVVDALLSI